MPGYQAPRDTVDPAARIPLLIMAILHDAAQAAPPGAAADRPMPRSVRADLKALRGLLASDLPEHQLGRAVLAWTQLIGSISFELFGHLHGVIVDYQGYFGYQMGRIGHELGLDLRRVPSSPPAAELLASVGRLALGSVGCRSASADSSTSSSDASCCSAR